MQTNHLTDKHGARITAIRAACHSTYKSVASWYFLGDLEFVRGEVLENREIAPYMLCADHDNAEAKAELDKVLDAMNDHLLKHGEWHKTTFTRDGRAVSWTPKAKQANTPM